MLLPAALMFGAAAAASAQEDHAHMTMPAPAAAAAAAAVGQSRWSDPKSWPDGKVPREGDAVTIGKDQNVVLDVSPPALRSLTVKGKLSFSNAKDLALETEWIYVAGGELDIGSEAHPHTRNAVITLTDNVKDENINTMGDRGIMLLNGALSLHGDRKNAWTKLSATAKAGATKIQVLKASGWRKGDVIVLASTDFNPRQAEERTITAISGNALTLDKPLAYMHFGQITDGVDERGEVGLLTRNIKIQASEDAEKTYFGGHIMAMAGSKMYLSGIELYRMGQNMHLARYPVHWHVLGEGKGQYIENSAIHDTYSRCVTVHGTNNLRVENNVTFNTVGHCFFLEDGIEHGNEFVKNLAIQTKCHPTLDCVPTNLAANGEKDPKYANRQAFTEASSTAGTPCCLRTTRWRPTGSPTRTIASSTMWRPAPTRTASGCPCRNTLKAPSRIRRPARPSGRGERRCARSEAMWPIPTSTGSCSTGTSTKTTPSVWPPSRSCRWPILLTWRARWWRRTSRT